MFSGSVPIIRSPKGNAAEMVAKKLDKKLRENLFDARNNLFHTDTQAGSFNFHRPLLILLDRNIDMATPLHHTWTYQALAHDLLNLALNRVMVDEAPTGGKRYDQTVEVWQILAVLGGFHLVSSCQTLRDTKQNFNVLTKIPTLFSQAHSFLKKINIISSCINIQTDSIEFDILRAYLKNYRKKMVLEEDNLTLCISLHCDYSSAYHHLQVLDQSPDLAS